MMSVFIFLKNCIIGGVICFYFERWENIFKISLYIYCIYKIYTYICARQKQIDMITLNENNCKEYTTEELEAKLLEVAIKKARKEVKKLHNIQKTNGWKSEEGREAMVKESNLYTEFLNAYGSENLLIMKSGKASNFGKLQNSKGNRYGNI